MKQHIRLIVILAVASVATMLPAVFSDFFNDDYLIWDSFSNGGSHFGAYDFVRADESEGNPWWAAEGLRLRFFRPLASLTLYLDIELLGGNPLVAHVHSLLWFVAFLIGGFFLLDRLLDGRPLTWAMIVLALGSFHTWAASWIAARHAVMGACFIVWAAFFYLRWRGDGSRRDVTLTFAFYTLGLLTSESALGFVGFVIGCELFALSRSIASRALAMSLYLAVAVLYVVLYKLFGYGPQFSGAYVDPVGDPGQYLTLAAPRVLSLLGVFTFSVPAMLRMMPRVEWVPVVAGIVGSGLLLLGLWLGREQSTPAMYRKLGWMALAALLAMAPALSGLVEGRGVMLSGVLFAGITGTTIAGLFGRGGKLLRRIPAIVVALLLCLGALVMSPLIRVAFSAFILMGSSAQTSLAEDSEISCQGGTRVFVINSDPFSSIVSPFILARQRGRFFSDWNQLALAEGEIQLSRLGPDRLRLEQEESLLGTSLHLFRRDFSDLTEGRRFEKQGLTVDIVEVNDEGPRVIDVTIPELSDPTRSCFLTFDHGHLRDVELPEIGESTQINYASPELN